MKLGTRPEKKPSFVKRRKNKKEEQKGDYDEDVEDEREGKKEGKRGRGNMLSPA